MTCIKDRYIDYVRAMYPHVRDRHGNPPEIVRLNVPLRTAICRGVPPADIGDNWWNATRAIYIDCIVFEGGDRRLPTVDDLVQHIHDNWKEVNE